jgi:stress response protein SCP2
LERAVVYIRRGFQAIRVDLAEIKGKLSNMPTTITPLALVVTVFGAAFALVKLANLN